MSYIFFLRYFVTFVSIHKVYEFDVRNMCETYVTCLHIGTFDRKEIEILELRTGRRLQYAETWCFYNFLFLVYY